MSNDQLLVVLAVAIATLGAVAILRPLGVPSPVVLVLAGLATGLIPFVPDVSLQPDVVLLGLLPLIVFQTAATASPTAMARHAGTIGALAIALVILTATAVAVVAHLLGGLSWPMAFVLGAAVCPTDSSAASGVAGRLHLPRRVLTILEGEALFNDVTGLVLLAAAETAATAGHFSVLHTVGSLGYAAAAGAGIGLVVGHVGRWARPRIDDPTLEIAGSILLAYAAYLPAEAIHASGVLATAIAGLYLGWHRSAGNISARSRLQAKAFWETLVFLIDAVLFVLLGLSARTFTSQEIGSVGSLLIAGVGVVAAVILVRLAFMFTAGWLIYPGAGAARSERHLKPQERVILGWTGMRGAITLAAILAVPEVTDSGLPLAGRDDVVYLGFAVILVTIVGQGLTLPGLVGRLQPREHPAVAETERQAQLELTRAAIEHLDATTAEGEADMELIAGLRAQYLQRARWLQVATAAECFSERAAGATTSELKIRRDLNAAQRNRLHHLRHTRAIGATTARAIEHELDLEEAKLTRA